MPLSLFKKKDKEISFRLEEIRGDLNLIKEENKRMNKCRAMEQGDLKNLIEQGATDNYIDCVGDCAQKIGEASARIKENKKALRKHLGHTHDPKGDLKKELAKLEIEEQEVMEE